MLIVMDAAASSEDVRHVVEVVRGLGLQAHPIPGAQRTAIGITGNRGTIDSGAFENLPGVSEVIPVSAPYKLVSREAKRENTVVLSGEGADELFAGYDRIFRWAGISSIWVMTTQSSKRSRTSRPAPYVTRRAALH